MIKSSMKLQILGLPQYFQGNGSQVGELLKLTISKNFRHRHRYIDISTSIKPDALRVGDMGDYLENLSTHTHTNGYNFSPVNPKCKITQMGRVYQDAYSNLETDFKGL